MKADIELEVRKLIEERLEHLPAETLKTIQAEIESHVERKEKEILRLGIVAGGLFAVFVIVVSRGEQNRTSFVVSKTGHFYQKVECFHRRVLGKQGVTDSCFG